MQIYFNAGSWQNNVHLFKQQSPSFYRGALYVCGQLL